MDKLIDDLLTDLVKLDKNDEYIFIHRLRDINGKEFKNQLEIAEYMQSNGLLKIEPKQGKRCFLTPEAREISKNGGWLKHLDNLAKMETDRQAKIDAREQLETDLAISNIEANKLNAKNAEQNRKDSRFNKTFLIINVVFVIINIAIAILQLMKPVK